MFDSSMTSNPEQAAPGAVVPVDASTVAAWTVALIASIRATDEDSERIDLIAELEKLKRIIGSVQADLAVDFDTSMRAKAEAQGIGKRRQGRGIDTQLGLARMETPARAKKHLSLATVLRKEMPHAHAAFRTGAISEYGVTLLVKETACVELDARQQIDEEIAADPEALMKMSDKQIGNRARTRAGELDPASVARARAKAEKDRRVSIRPAPDTMAYVTGLLPVGQGVAVIAALTKAADTLINSGDERSRGQIMADTFVQRLTGQAAASDVPVAVNLVVSDTSLLGTDNNAAHLAGHGTIPADLARHLIANSLDAGITTWLRKIYAGTHGGLVKMDAKARTVPHGLARLLRLRDGNTCRNLWCDAPIRHIDHAHGVINGGQTTEENLQGLCEACNYAKQAPGWSATGQHPPDQRHRVTTTTPTGHHYTSTAPPLPEPARPPAHLSPVAAQFSEQIAARRRRLTIELYRGPSIDYAA
ncbi:DUF222 domain-containing protein [Nocardioides sp. JQ2195]|uniref:HNH endonuclease n=1 Tax=Nocardioides sp. JQ2195 TaxID=2592334 RepID=UPI00143EB173|nr:HNH endonuclease signature motif containing protein [Nocardioides sp. JQ2195]QIX28073.1 DUF222 domain-containing protein [Nocardioides sp. JQ2195]